MHFGSKSYLWLFGFYTQCLGNIIKHVPKLCSIVLLIRFQVREDGKYYRNGKCKKDKRPRAPVPTERKICMVLHVIIFYKVNKNFM